MPRYRRHFEYGQTVFLTLTTARKPWLAGPGVRDEMLEALRQARRRHPFRHHGHVLLDDHLHLLLSPHAGVSVPKLVGSFKRAVLARLPGGIANREGRLWQRRYYDHVIRDTDDFAKHLDYLHFNPVKHGLAPDAGAWRWSSFAAWRARGTYPEGWGRCEPAHIRDIVE
jgi:putative transposase